MGSSEKTKWENNNIIIILYIFAFANFKTLGMKYQGKNKKK